MLSSCFWIRSSYTLVKNSMVASLLPWYSMSLTFPFTSVYTDLRYMLSLSISKSDPALATISEGTTTVDPIDGSKNPLILNTSVEDIAWWGIRNPTPNKIFWFSDLLRYSRIWSSVLPGKFFFQKFGIITSIYLFPSSFW